MRDTIQITFKDVPMVVAFDFVGDYSITLEPIYHDFTDWYIDDLSACTDSKINDLIHDLIGNNPFEKEELIKCIIRRLQEIQESDEVELRRAM